MNKLARWFKLRAFWAVRAVFYRDLAEALRDREMLTGFIEGELKISTNPATEDPVRAVGIMDMHKNMLRSGSTSLDEVLKKSMPESDAMGLTILRESPNQSKSLLELAANVDQQTEMTNAVSKALIAPLVLAPVGYVFAYVVSAKSIPVFTEAAPAEIWVGFSALTRDFAAIFSNYAHWALLVVAIYIGWISIWALPKLTSSWRYKAERATGSGRLFWFLLTGPAQPIFSVYRDIQSARMLANLATLLQAGRGLHEAITTLSDSASPWMRRHLLRVIQHMEISPGDYVGAFSHGILSKAILARMHTKVRRDAGSDFASVLIELGTLGQVTARESAMKQASSANGILLAIVMGIVMFFYLGQQWIILSIQEANTPTAIKKRLNSKMKNTQTIAPKSPVKTQ